jgi:hypothetical protein
MLRSFKRRFLKRLRSLLRVRSLEPQSETSQALTVVPAFRLPIAERFATTLDLAPLSVLPVYGTEPAPPSSPSIKTVEIITPPSSPHRQGRDRRSLLSRVSSTIVASIPSRPTSPTTSSIRTLSISYPLTRPSEKDADVSTLASTVVQSPTGYLFPFPVMNDPNKRLSWLSEVSEDEYTSDRRSRSISNNALLRSRMPSSPRHSRLYSFSSITSASSVYSHVTIIDAVNSRKARQVLVKSIESMFDRDGRERPNGLGIDEIPPVPALPHPRLSF